MVLSRTESHRLTPARVRPGGVFFVRCIRPAVLLGRFVVAHPWWLCCLTKRGRIAERATETGPKTDANCAAQPPPTVGPELAPTARAVQREFRTTYWRATNQGLVDVAPVLETLMSAACSTVSPHASAQIFVRPWDNMLGTAIVVVDQRVLLIHDYFWATPMSWWQLRQLMARMVADLQSTGTLWGSLASPVGHASAQ